MKLQLTILAALLLSSNVSHAEVQFLSRGHTDLALDFDPAAKRWNVYVGSDLTGAEFAPEEVVLEVIAAAQTTVPAGANFAFLGAPGSPVWILPQAQNEELLYLGYGGDGLPVDVFTGNRVSVALKSIRGPGDFFSYRVDGFGTPEVLFNTRDGINETDVGTVQVGGDAHLNWAFTQAGDYAVVVEVSGTLLNGNQTVASGPITFTFSVLKPVVPLATEHVDLRVLYSTDGTNNLSFVARDEDHHINYPTNECVLVVNEAAKLALPGGTPFGNEGDPLYVLPQSQNPDLLYLGISTEDIPAEVLSGNLNVRLESVVGPGNFYLWQASSFGDFNVRMNTADGISEDDQTTPLVGGHEHFNWGFTAPGAYQITFQITGRRIGDTSDITSPLTTFTFQVLPLPPEHPNLRIAQVAANGDLQVEITGSVGATYNVQTSEDLSAWKLLQPIALTGTTITVLVPATGARMFVRLVAP